MTRNIRKHQRDPAPAAALTGESRWAGQLVRSRAKRAPPTAGNAKKTFDKILLAAAELLDEAGFERLSTNDICARASVTTPALYHYFHDKYDILEELTLRLLRKQNEAFYVWLVNGGVIGTAGQRKEALAEWFRIAAGVTAGEPGALAILRATHALPELAPLRLASQRMLTDQLCDIYHRLNPDLDPQMLWYRLRISCEFGFMVDELALEEDRIENDTLFKEVAAMLVPPT